jgi:hypothetical protein
MACVLLTAGVYAQARPAGQATDQKPQLSEEAFKNVRVLRGITVKEFMGTMGFFAASLSLNCTDCHGGASASDWANYAIDTPLKNRARLMIAMVKSINDANFGGRPFVTCYTCHRGSQQPKVIASLAHTVSAARRSRRNRSWPAIRQTATPDQILDKILRRLVARALAKLTSFTAKGTYEGFDSDFGKVPVDVYAKAPNLRATVVHMLGGDSTSTYDGREAWQAGPATLTPVPLMPLVGADLGGARLDAQLFFPGQIKQLLTNWRADFPATTIENKPVQVVQGSMPDGTRVKLYFDKASGLLVRQTRYATTAVGTIPTHIVYSDYREVPGVGAKIPFSWQVTWVDGQSTINVTSVQPNAAIDAARFAKPAPPR